MTRFCFSQTSNIVCGGHPREVREAIRRILNSYLIRRSSRSWVELLDGSGGEVVPGLLSLVRVVPTVGAVPVVQRRSGTVPPRPPHNLHIRLPLPLSCRQPLSQVKSQDQTSCQTTQWIFERPLPLPRHSICGSMNRRISNHNFRRGRDYQVSAYSATIDSITSTFYLIHLMTAGFCRVSCFCDSSE